MGCIGCCIMGADCACRMGSGLGAGGDVLSAWAKVGAKCVCVKTCAGFNGLAPVVGETYVVAAPWRNGPFSGEPQAVFRRLDGALLHSGGGILIDRFRPVTTRSQEDDVALIKSLLVGDEVSA